MVVYGDSPEDLLDDDLDIEELKTHRSTVASRQQNESSVSSINDDSLTVLAVLGSLQMKR
jgi:hypothetical protein